ncbi:Golgi transport complex subunit 5-domain-containing protein [Sporodiniella umbellata]|nr:Golgi transport complex subunit 5-domain-containing protein [Sporodiniella umbellata]
MTRAVSQGTDKYIDYDLFLAENFKPESYVDTVVQTAEHEKDEEEISTAFSKLTFGIDMLNKQIQEQVNTNYETLLKQSTGMKDMEKVVDAIEFDVDQLHDSLQSIAIKIVDPYQNLSQYARQFENLQATCDLLRKLHRFIVLKHRLETQLLSTSSADHISTAALILYELETVIKECDFDGIDIVALALPEIGESRDRIEQEANNLLREGIESQNQSKMAAGLQVFYNIKEMGQKLQQIVEEMLDNLIQEIRQVVNVQSLQKAIGGNASKNTSQWTTLLWERMGALMKSMGDYCIKIYSLEKVLEIKKDPLTQVSFLEEVAKVLDASSLISHFWQVLSANFEKELKQAVRASTFVHTIFVGDYPKLLKFLHEFFSRLALSNGTPLSDYLQTPEYVIMLRSFHAFQTGFVTKSRQKMFDAVNTAFPAYGALTRSPPTRSNSINVVRVIGHELEIASIEPQLAQEVAKNATKALSSFCGKCENLLPSNEQPIYSNGANSVVTNYLNINIETADVLYYIHQSMWKVLEEYSEKITDIVIGEVQNCHTLMQKIGTNLVNLIKKDSEQVLLKMHQESFSGQLRRSFEPNDEKSNYMKELANRVRYYHTQILQHFSCGEEPKIWVKAIGQHILQVFVFQASLIRPLSEAGKLKLAGDMAELEFTISQFVSEYSVKMEQLGAAYKALRTFRPLLFLDSAQLTAAHHTADLSKLVLIHHLIVRSHSGNKGLPLPNTVYDLSRHDYMKWMDSQTEKEAVQLALDAITKGNRSALNDLQDIPEFKLIIELASEEQ